VIRSLLLLLLTALTLPASRGAEEGPVRVTIFAACKEYRAAESLPKLKARLEATGSARVELFQGTDKGSDLEGFSTLDQADVAVIFTRRVKLPPAALDQMKAFCRAGKGLVGIRTASHAFDGWPTFDREILGGDYQNHRDERPAKLKILRDHFILQRIHRIPHHGEALQEPEAGGGHHAPTPGHYRRSNRAGRVGARNRKAACLLHLARDSRGLRATRLHPDARAGGLLDSAPGASRPLSTYRIRYNLPFAAAKWGSANSRKLILMFRSSNTQLVRAFIVALAVCASLPAAQAATIVLNPSKDNTLFENPTGSESNGSGENFFAGRTGVNDSFHIRRGLIAFNLSSIPANAVITDVTLTLFLAQAGSGSFGSQVSLYSLNADWGEGASIGFSGNPGVSATGDATWIHRFFSNQLWSTPGGDFDPEASAITSISSAFQKYSWSGAGMVEDVQAWVTNPATNFGWILRGNETGSSTALRFNTRETSIADNRPQLSVTFTVVPEPSVGAGLAPAICGLLLRRRRS
jgi:hypothetical protein